VLRPVARIVRGQKPQLRYALAQVLHGSGKILGSLNVRINHR
jgi:hypothetical protein